MDSGEATEKSRIVDNMVEPSKTLQQPPASEPVNSSDVEKLVEDDDLKDSDRSGIPGASLNTANSILGSGIIGIPYAFKQAGFILGMVILLIVALITDYSLGILIKAAELSGTSSYQDLLQASYGRAGYYLLTIVQFIYPMVAMIGYHVIIGDTLSQVFVGIFGINHVLANRYFVISVVTLVVLLPLSLYKNVTKLVKVAFVSLLLLVFLAFFIFLRLGTMKIDFPEDTGNVWTVARPLALESVSIITFAYICHHNAFLIFTSLKTPDLTTWDKVTHWAVGTATILGFAVGIGGFLTFRGLSQGDVLQNYCFDDFLANLARVAFAITIMCTYPLECFVCRDVLENFFIRHGWISSPATLETHLINTLIIVAVALGVSMSTECLGIVLILNGIFGAVPLIMILPSAAYLRWESGGIFERKKLPALILAIVGILVVGSGLLTIILDPNAASCKTSEHFAYCSPSASNSSLGWVES